MPARIIPIRRTLQSLVLISIFALSVLYVGTVRPVSAGTRTNAINSALGWLVIHQSPDGSYGSFSELEVAPAANALWIRFGNTPTVALSYNFLKNQMQNSSTWFWGTTGEADVPGEVLYSFDVSQHLKMLNSTFVSSNLLSFQQANGGFKGYFNPSTSQVVTSSVDTAMALWGLINAKAIPPSNELSAINYLLSLQNPNGSFNLTKTVISDPLYSLGPEPISITALVTLVLKDASYTLNDPHVSSAMTFLTNAASSSFAGHVYAASLSALVFTFFYRQSLAAEAVSFVLSQQQPDGGFSDIIRFCKCANPLDTGWAAIALELGGLAGDVNLDGVVNIIDISIIAAAYQTTPGTPHWVPHADIDGDGVVNIIDIAIAAAMYGKTADSL